MRLDRTCMRGTLTGTLAVTFAGFLMAQGPPVGLSLGPPRLLDLGETGNPAQAVMVGDRVMVLDRSNRQIVAFDLAGRRLSAVGREGAGPGEFRSPSGLWAVGDSVLVYDHTLRRVTVLGPGAAVARTATLAAHPRGRGLPLVVAVVAPGKLVTSWLTGVRNGFARDTTLLTLHAPSGEPADDLGFWPGDDRLTIRIGNVFHTYVPPFASRLLVAACGSDLAIANGLSPEVYLLAPVGSTRRIVPLPFLPPAPSITALRDIDARWVRNTAADHPAFTVEAGLEALRAANGAGRQPSMVGGLLFDPECRLWVAAAGVRNGSTRWWRIDRQGTPIAVLDLPPGQTLRTMGRNHVVVEQTDADGLTTFWVLQINGGDRDTDP